MVAVPRLGKKDNVVKPRIKGEKIPSLLKVAAIYGPNASGKSNFIEAIAFIQRLLNSKPSEPLPVAPFRFDPSLANQPSRFEYHFLAGNQRYEFHLALTSERIMEERLISYPNGKETPLYARQVSPEGEEYEIGNALEGDTTLHEAWKNLTSPKQLFIAQAVTNSNEKLQQLRVPFTWLSKGLRGLNHNLDQLPQIALAIASETPALGFEKYVASFLHDIDIPVSNVKIESLADAPTRIMSTLSGNPSDDQMDEVRSSVKNVRTTLTHKTALGEAQFDLNEESAGTKNLIGFALPWMAMNLNSPELQVLAVDEFDSSLHPQIIARLIEKLISSEHTTQLIFTTHDTHLMNTKLLRRDQLWLAERDINGATQLRSIHDFKGRESEDVEKRYYEGRYRGLPILL